MLVEGGDAEVCGRVPEPNGAFGGASGVHVERIVGDFFGLVDEAALVDDVALGLPLPYDHLAEGFYAQG